jgi:hypothetical protein
MPPPRTIMRPCEPPTDRGATMRSLLGTIQHLGAADVEGEVAEHAAFSFLDGQAAWGGTLMVTRT